MTNIIGIDPGVKGAWAILDRNGNYCASGKLPDLPRVVAGATTLCAAVEHQGARHGDIGPKMFHVQKLLINYGWIQGVLDSAGIPWQIIHPLKWQGHFKIQGKGVMRKRQYLGLARKIWPDAPLKSLNTDGTAAALLLAEYYRQTEGLICATHKWS